VFLAEQGRVLGRARLGRLGRQGRAALALIRVRSADRQPFSVADRT
jgi:hypothetical protein